MLSALACTSSVNLIDFPVTKLGLGRKVALRVLRYVLVQKALQMDLSTLFPCALYELSPGAISLVEENVTCLGDRS